MQIPAADNVTISPDESPRKDSSSGNIKFPETLRTS